MIRLTKVIRQVVVVTVMSTIEYRGSFLIYMVNAVLVPVISLLVWLAVSAQGVQLPYSREQFVTYYIMLSVVSILTGTWLAEFVAESIRLGQLSPWLLRPVPYIVQDIGNNIGEKVVKLPMLLPLSAIVALFFRDSLHFPANPLNWLLFLVSLPLAAAVAFLLDFVIGSLAFWIQDVGGLIRTQALVGAFLAGEFVPLALFPHSLSGFVQLQPFRYTLSFPIEVLTGSLSREELALGFGCELAYCVLLWGCYRLMWRYGLRAYSAVGA